MRAFIAIDIPEEATAAIAAVQAQLRSIGVAAGWSRPAGLHLTLKFLGEVPADRATEIVQALTLALGGMERFRLCLAGVGAFPNPASARVVWLGIAGDTGRLVALQAAVERVMVGLGLARDDRPYVPHLTLGRIRRIRNRDAWLKELAGLKDFKLPGFDVTAISLIRSELLPTGAVYHELGTVSFNNDPGPRSL